MVKRILLFKAKLICYGSNEYFTDCFEKALLEAGCSVDVCDITVEDALEKENEMEDRLAEYIGMTYDAIIDFNSILPRVRLEDGSFFLNHIDGPFFNYIVDHPLYHHPILKLGINDYNVICLDNRHADYIKQFYPHINKVIVMPIPAMKSLTDIDLSDRKYDIVFMGTYTMPDKVLEKYRYDNENINKDIYDLIDIMKADTSLDAKAACDILLSKKNISPDNEEYRQLLNIYFPADMYIRAYYRDVMLKNIVKSGMKLDVFGHGWEDFSLYNASNLIVHKPVGYGVSIEIMADSKMIINMMPWFKDGMHDRVYSSMVNRCVCVTDGNDYLNKIFTDNENILIYNIDRLCELPDRINEVLSDNDRMCCISENGYKAVKNICEWKEMAAAFAQKL